jgi:hypothetical protein
MKMINELLSKITFTALLFLLFLVIFGCDNSEKVEDKVTKFQLSIDSVLTNVVLPMNTSIDTAILNSEAGKDTFQLARQRIPITKVQFLISNEYFELDNALKAYSAKKMSEIELLEQLNQSQIMVDFWVKALKNIKNHSLNKD